jgi:hypothetical protein
LAQPCGSACAASVVPGLDDIITTDVTVLAAPTALALLVRRVARCMREHRPNRAANLTAARWRAERAPHPLTAADRAHLGATLPIEVGHEVRAVA